MRLFYSTDTKTLIHLCWIHVLTFDVQCSSLLIFSFSFSLSSDVYVHRYRGIWQDLVNINGRHFCIYGMRMASACWCKRIKIFHSISYNVWTLNIHIMFINLKYSKEIYKSCKCHISIIQKSIEIFLRKEKESSFNINKLHKLNVIMKMNTVILNTYSLSIGVYRYFSTFA